MGEGQPLSQAHSPAPQPEDTVRLPRGRLHNIQLPPAHHRRLLSGSLPLRKLYGGALSEGCPSGNDENHQGNGRRVRRGVEGKLQEEGPGSEGAERLMEDAEE